MLCTVRRCNYQPEFCSGIGFADRPLQTYVILTPPSPFHGAGERVTGFGANDRASASRRHSRSEPDDGERPSPSPSGRRRKSSSKPPILQKSSSLRLTEPEGDDRLFGAPPSGEQQRALMKTASRRRMLQDSEADAIVAASDKKRKPLFKSKGAITESVLQEPTTDDVSSSSQGVTWVHADTGSATTAAAGPQELWPPHSFPSFSTVPSRHSSFASLDPPPFLPSPSQPHQHAAFMHLQQHWQQMPQQQRQRRSHPPPVPPPHHWPFREVDWQPWSRARVEPLGAFGFACN